MCTWLPLTSKVAARNITKWIRQLFWLASTKIEPRLYLWWLQLTNSSFSSLPLKFASLSVNSSLKTWCTWKRQTNRPQVGLLTTTLLVQAILKRVMNPPKLLLLMLDKVTTIWGIPINRVLTNLDSVGTQMARWTQSTPSRGEGRRVARIWTTTKICPARLESLPTKRNDWFKIINSTRISRGPAKANVRPWPSKMVQSQAVLHPFATFLR